MAGVNLNEESARILATNSELVGTHIRSCKDEAFLPTGLLHRRILETGALSHTHTHEYYQLLFKIYDICIVMVHHIYGFLNLLN